MSNEQEVTDLEICEEQLESIAAKIMDFGGQLGFYDEEFVPILVLVVRKLQEEFNVADVRPLNEELNQQ